MLEGKNLNEITTIIISAITSFIISLIVVYVLNTPLGCYLGIHQYKQEGSGGTTPIEYHMLCLRCGKTKTVYRK